MRPYVFAYLDDVIVGLTLSPDKCHFCRSEVKYLVFKINQDGLVVDDDKVRPLLEYPRPRNLRQLWRFVGATSCYRRFIKDYSKMCEPLSRLTKKDQPYHWRDEQEEAFVAIKIALISSPVLAYPNFELPFCVQTDASESRLGVVVTQIQDGQERVIAYASRVLSEAERNYSTTEKECLAVVWAFRKFRYYQEGYHFTVISNHSSLKWLHNLRNPTGRLARWALDLLAYDFDIIHRKRAMHHVPDALSRMFENERVEKLSVLEIIKDEWCSRRREDVINSPNKFHCWRVVDDRLYKYRSNPLRSEEHTSELQSR